MLMFVESQRVHI